MVHTLVTANGTKEVVKGKLILVKSDYAPVVSDLAINTGGDVFVWNAEHANFIKGYGGNFNAIKKVIPVVISTTDKLEAGDIFFDEESGKLNFANPLVIDYHNSLIDKGEVHDTFKVIAKSFTNSIGKSIEDGIYKDGYDIWVSANHYPNGSFDVYPVESITSKLPEAKENQVQWFFDNITFLLNPDQQQELILMLIGSKQQMPVN